MINTIIFDMGQVLIQWKPETMLTDLQLTQDETKLVVQELFQSAEWVRQDRGTITEQEVVDAVCARLPKKLHCAVETMVFGWHQRFLAPMPGMAELVRDLKEAGYRIYLLSNASLALRSYFPWIPGSEYFDGLMVSAEEKLLKPQHEIYEALYDRFSLNPATCFFVDDSPANIEGAYCTGMAGTVFRGNAARLRREMAAAGIRVAL